MIRIVVLVCLLAVGSWGHGRLRDPPSRSSAWRDGFKTPVNWNDNELYCGGVAQPLTGGRCGICGDPFSQAQPRANELGGKYGKGVITRTYKRGQVIETWVELTKAHLGYFEFRICPLSGDGKDATQECLDQHVLKVSDGSDTKVRVDNTLKNYRVQVKLPDNLTCDHCVVQWNYRTGNRWGICPSGKGATGCGPQETFRGCADVKIEA